MAYFKGTIISGNEEKDCFVQAQNALWAMRKFEMKLNSCKGEKVCNVNKISEAEFTINACVVSDVRNNTIKTLSSKEISKIVMPMFVEERKLYPLYKIDDIASTMLLLVKNCFEATSSKDRVIYERVLSNWLTYNYEHQDEILSDKLEEEQDLSHSA